MAWNESDFRFRPSGYRTPSFDEQKAASSRAGQVFHEMASRQGRMTQEGRSPSSDEINTLKSLRRDWNRNLKSTPQGIFASGVDLGQDPFGAQELYRLMSGQLRHDAPKSYDKMYPFNLANIVDTAIKVSALRHLQTVANMVMPNRVPTVPQNVLDMRSRFPGTDVDDDDYQYWHLLNEEDGEEKANGGIMSLKNYMHGGSHAPPSYSNPYVPAPSTSIGQSLHGGRQYDNPGYVPPNYNYTIGYDEGQVDPSLAAAAGLGPAAGGFGGTTVGWGEGVDGEDTTRIPGGGGYSPSYYGGQQYSGAPLQNEDDDISTLGSSALRERAEKQFDTQFMAAQLLHDRSRGKFDQGGLADMSEGTLESFDVAKSKWKWKYDEQIRGLMGKGFSLKEAIDEMWNKYQMMPYKGFSMEVT